MSKEQELAALVGELINRMDKFVEVAIRDLYVIHHGINQIRAIEHELRLQKDPGHGDGPVGDDLRRDDTDGPGGIVYP